VLVCVVDNDVDDAEGVSDQPARWLAAKYPRMPHANESVLSAGDDHVGDRTEVERVHTATD